MRRWCDRINRKPKRTLGRARPIELFATESTALKRLPAHIPEVYLIHRRTVDESGLVNLHCNRYSSPLTLLERELTVHETQDKVRLYDGHRLVCEHPRLETGTDKRSVLPEHERERREQRWSGKKRALERPQAKTLRSRSAELAAMVLAIEKRGRGLSTTRALQRLYRMWTQYPQDALDRALSIALAHGLFDLNRIETLVLRHVAGNFFRLPTDNEDPPDE
jgi:hypothetical protein